MPHLRRVGTSGVDLITFQFDKWGGGFVLEIAGASLDGFTTHWGLHIPVNKLRACDLHPDDRHRIQAREGSGTDAWFRFDQEEPARRVAQRVLQSLSGAEAWWQAMVQQRAAGDVRNARA